jgi:hypothetical protein
MDIADDEDDDGVVVAFVEALVPLDEPPQAVAPRARARAPTPTLAARGRESMGVPPERVGVHRQFALSPRSDCDFAGSIRNATAYEHQL